MVVDEGFRLVPIKKNTTKKKPCSPLRSRCRNDVTRYVQFDFITIDWDVTKRPEHNKNVKTETVSHSTGLKELAFPLFIIC